jgi:hypothetical protein
MLDAKLEVSLLNLGLLRGLSNQHIQACAIMGNKGWAPNRKQLQMTESLVDLNNQVQIKAGGTVADPLADLKKSLGLAPMTTETVTTPAVDHTAKEYKNMNRKFDILINTGTKTNQLLETLIAPPTK